MSNLDGFISHSQSLPECIATSSEIMDRESVFVASIFRASSPARARAAQAHLKRVVHAQKPATHEMFAYRCMVLKDGRDGLGDDDFKVVEDSEDDNEQWAGARILKVLKAEAVMDAVVIVSRWYGGVMLGPIRFTHIEDCAREVCKSFRAKDEMDDCIATLVAHDDTLAKLRTELEELRTPTTKAAETTPMTLAHDETVEDSTFKRAAREEVEQPPSKKRKVESSQDYSGLRKSTDLPKARRLITARESAIKVVQKLIDKAKGDF